MAKSTGLVLLNGKGGVAQHTGHVNSELLDSLAKVKVVTRNGCIRA